MVIACFGGVSIATSVQETVTASTLYQARAHPAREKEFTRAGGAVFTVFALQRPVICKQRQSMSVICRGPFEFAPQIERCSSGRNESVH